MKSAHTTLRSASARRAPAVLAGWLLALLAMCLLSFQAHAQSRTIVSLTFDDGLTQSPVRALLLKYGFKGTFYINANMIGTGGGYLTRAELDALAADGNEIGGHTTSHVDLATLSDAAQRTAICGDLQTLNSWYPGKVHSFAYPFASTGPTTQTIVAEGCAGVGSYSARTVGGLVSGSQCTDCAVAETIPPANPYYINSPESILSTTTLEQIKTLVTQAENGGGGWVPLVFHSVCDGCSSYGVTPATLDAFLAWLKTREASNTHVRTVYQVMSGDLPSAPPPVPPPPLGPNLLLNASVETDQDGNGVSDCFMRNNWGTNSVAWSRVAGGHSGTFAERVQVTSYSSGDAKVLPVLDAGQAAGGCAPAVEATATYEFGLWYQSTVAVTPVLFYRNSAGTWVYWRDGPLQPASTAWRQLAYNPGALPSGATSVSFGLALDSTGTVTTDDYSLRKVGGGTADTVAPTVVIASPTSGAVTGTVDITATASDNVGVTGVQFRVNGANLGAEDTAAPYAASWSTAGLANGSYSLTAVARDAQGNTTTSAAVTVTVNNADTTAPQVSLSAPAAGTVSGAVTVTATATDNVGVAGVQFRLNGVNLGTEDTGSPYSISWNSATAANGSYSLTAVARDAQGNTTTSAPVTVTVNNLDTTAPQVSLSAPAAGNVSGTVVVTATASDNVGVAGVQFRINGVALGSEDTAAPFSISWNTASLANGSYSLTAVARDAQGNTTTSAPVTVTVNNVVTDTTPPQVALSAPAAGTVVGTVTISANASDNIGVAGVQFRLNGVNLGAEDTVAPYSFSWNSTTSTNGSYSLTAVARDAQGNTTTSAPVTVTVNNVVTDTTPPQVALSAPAAGAVVGTVTISANASDNIGVAGVQFRLNGVNLGTEDTVAPYSFSWNSTTSTNGSYSLTAVARDARGNTTTSAPVTVTVNNVVTDTTPPQVALSAPAAGAVVGTVTISANASDNIGVAGVQFRLNGVNLGAEDTVAPYSFSWNSTTSTNGSYSLTAVARDAGGNTTTSTPVTVTVNNAAAGGLTIVNASLESDTNADGISDCWQRAGYGTNTAVWSRVSGARTGSFSEQVQITARTSGDRKLIHTLDSGACARAVTPGLRYTLGTWYRSTVPTNFVVYYRTSAGVWIYWTSSANLAASATWRSASLTTVAVPAGATHISYGIALSRVGTLATDDYSMSVAP